MRSTAPDSTPPLIVLGFDVGDPQWLQQWAAEGYMPTLTSVMERGAWGRTAGPELITEHSVWVSLMSGISVSRHGFYYYRRLKPGTYDLQSLTGRDIEAPPFWSHIVTPGKKAALIDVPHCYPPSGIAGIHLAEWASHHPSFPPSASPPALLDEARRVFGPQMRIPELLRSSYRRDRRTYRRLQERIRKKGALCRHLLAQDRFDLAVIVFGDTHAAGHQFWKYRPELQGSGHAAADGALTHAIRDVYQQVDHEMGRLLDRLPGDANVCIVSSTGLVDHYPTAGLIEAFCRRLGYQAAPAPADRPGPMYLARRMIPTTWRYALSRLLPEATQQRLMNDKFRSGTDWDRTTAFAIPSLFKSFIRVNLKGREPRGTVRPGAEYEALLERLEADLMRLTDPKTGRAAVKEVIRTGDRFVGAPPDILPDLFVDWQPAAHYMDRVIHPEAELVPDYPPEIFRESDHSHLGFVAMAGPSIVKRGDLGDVDLLSLAPTFLALMGEPVPSEMTGRPLESPAGNPRGDG